MSLLVQYLLFIVLHLLHSCYAVFGGVAYIRLKLNIMQGMG